MESDTTIAVLGLLLLLAVIGLVFMAVELEEAWSHQKYLRGQVNKYRREAHELGDGEGDRPSGSASGTPPGVAYDPQSPSSRPPF